MTLVHQLVGYDKATETVAYEHDFRPEEWRRIRKFLDADPGDPDMVYAYPIDGHRVVEIASVIQAPVGNLNYFIECSARD